MAKDKNKGGRPTKYDIKYNDTVEKLCKIGATDKQVAKALDVTEKTVNNWKLKDKEFLQSLKRGKEVADNEVEDSLYKRAMGSEHPDVHVSNYKGAITTTELTKHYPPDPTSMIFWLKNRRPDKWREKQEVEHSGDFQVEMIIDGKTVKD